MQHLLSRARCDEQQLLDSAADWAAAHLTSGRGQNDVVLIVDETADAKSSADCAGAARQYSGTLGGIALCQVAVTLTCATPAGHALIGRALYLPADWAADDERRELAGVPDEATFATKPELACRLLQHARPRSARFEPVPFVKDVMTPVPRVLLSATLAGPAPSGGAGTPRLCQGCSRPPRHHPDQAALSFTALLRQGGGEGLSPPLEQTAPHGAGLRTGTTATPTRPALAA